MRQFLIQSRPFVVTLVVTVLYVGVVLRADNHGEGGLMSLITLLGRRGRDGRRLSPRLVAGLTAAGIAGASLFLADSMITPAVSVVSAVEGLNVATPSLSHLVVPIARTYPLDRAAEALTYLADGHPGGKIALIP